MGERGGCGQSPIQWVKTLLSPRQLCEENRDWETFIRTKKRDYENREISRNDNFAKPMFFEGTFAPKYCVTREKIKGAKEREKYIFELQKNAFLNTLFPFLIKKNVGMTSTFSCSANG